jgi:hypothetical protein
VNDDFEEREYARIRESYKSEDSGITTQRDRLYGGRILLIRLMCIITWLACIWASLAHGQPGYLLGAVIVHVGCSAFTVLCEISTRLNKSQKP